MTTIRYVNLVCLADGEIVVAGEFTSLPCDGNETAKA